jgi:hypothetical protein
MWPPATRNFPAVIGGNENDQLAENVTHGT